MTTAEIARRVLVRNLGKTVTIFGAGRTWRGVVLETDLRAHSFLSFPLSTIREIFPGTMGKLGVLAHRQQHGRL